MAIAIARADNGVRPGISTTTTTFPPQKFFPSFTPYGRLLAVRKAEVAWGCPREKAPARPSRWSANLPNLWLLDVPFVVV